MKNGEMGPNRKNTYLQAGKEEQEYTIVVSEFPHTYSQIAYIIISDTKYINTGFIYGSPVKLSGVLFHQ